MRILIISFAVMSFITFLSLAIISGVEYRTVSSEVLKKANDEGSVRVYVILKEPPHISNLRSVDVLSLVESRQSSVIAQTNPMQLRLQTNGNFFADLSEEDIRKLSNDARVARIELEQVRHVFLQDSVLQSNATLTHSLVENNLNLTGVGQTVCIIDTGANYTHPDLGGCFGNNNASSTCKVLGGYDFANSDSDPYDDNGHGMHVAGIVAANGSIKGVAPGAKLIVIKACNAGGTCADSDISAGIGWCVGNASAYNISVISMSLGSNLSTIYCNNDPLAPDIQNAIAKNISVVIATGNGRDNNGIGNSTAIAFPSCVENVTAVGAVNKQDAITSYSNQFSIMRLLAPGGVSTNSATKINSTCISGDSASGYCGKQGTSMAAPHAAGAIAIIREYLNLSNQKKTPQQIEAVLNNTGKRITDSNTGINYSRINIYSAIISLDVTAPNITLTSPANATSSLNVNQTFRCNATDLSLRNVTLFVWNSSSSIINQSVRTISGSNNAAEFNATNLTRGTHQWNCLFSDENNNAAFAASNRTITVADLTTTLAAPASGLIISSNQTLSCNATTTATLSNSTLYVWNSTGALINTTVQNISGTVNTTNFSYNFLSEEVHSWNCLFVTITSLEQFANTNFTVTYDVTRPRVNITTPANNSWQNKGNLNVTLNENGSCLASFTGGVTNITLSSNDNRIFNATNITLTHGTSYNASYYCNDSAGNFNRSTVQSFTADLTGANVTLLAPNNSHNLTASSTNFVFNYSIVDEINISSCSLILNGAVNLTNSSITNISANHSFTQTLSAAAYTWIVNCTDEAGNIGNSSARTITLSAPASDSGSSSSGGGGGGGGGAAVITSTTYRPTLSDAQQGYTRPLKPSDSIKVSIPSVPSAVTGSGTGAGSGVVNTTEHTVTVDNVTATSAYITVRSNPIKIVLNVGQSAKLNFTSAMYYDLFVKLENIVGTSANVTIRVISELIPASDSSSISSFITNRTNNATMQDNENATSSGQGDSGKKSKRVWIIIIIILIILGIIAAISIYLFKYWRGLEKKTGNSEKDESH